MSTATLPRPPRNSTGVVFQARRTPGLERSPDHAGLRSRASVSVFVNLVCAVFGARSLMFVIPLVQAFHKSARFHARQWALCRNRGVLALLGVEREHIRAWSCRIVVFSFR